MNWREHEDSHPKRTREESFQFWYRSVVLALLTAGITGIGAVIVFQWQSSVDMASVKVQLAGINVAVAGVPEMKEKIAVLEEANEDMKRRMEVYEGVRSVK